MLSVKPGDSSEGEEGRPREATAIAQDRRFGKNVAGLQHTHAHACMHVRYHMDTTMHSHTCIRTHINIHIHTYLHRHRYISVCQRSQGIDRRFG